MGGHPFPEINCIVCNHPITLETDLNADENGKPVHEECYVNNLTSARSNQTAAGKLLDMLSSQLPPLCCPECGSPFSHLDATFFLQSGKSCTIPLPVCDCRERHDDTPLHMDAQRLARLEMAETFNSDPKLTN
jgi:hypothetical protein